MKTSHHSANDGTDSAQKDLMGLINQTEDLSIFGVMQGRSSETELSDHPRCLGELRALRRHFCGVDCTGYKYLLVLA